MDTASIGRFFREMRTSKNMTQLDVATKLGISPQAVSKWERSECLPDISLFQDIAAMFNIDVSDILNAGVSGGRDETVQFIELLNNAVDEKVFKKMTDSLQGVRHISDIPYETGLDIMAFLNARQKLEIILLLLHMEGYPLILDDILQYTNNAMREKITEILLEKEDYDSLEMLVPFMSRGLKDTVVARLLEMGAFDFLEGMLPFLNRHHKDMIIAFVLGSSPGQGNEKEMLENFMPFFDQRQKDTIEAADL